MAERSKRPSATADFAAVDVDERQLENHKRVRSEPPQQQSLVKDEEKPDDEYVAADLQQEYNDGGKHLNFTSSAPLENGMSETPHMSGSFAAGVASTTPNPLSPPALLGLDPKIALELQEYDSFLPPAPVISSELVQGIGRFYNILPSERRNKKEARPLSAVPVEMFAPLGRSTEFLLRLILQQAQQLASRSLSSFRQGGALTASNMWDALEILHVQRPDVAVTATSAAFPIHPNCAFGTASLPVGPWTGANFPAVSLVPSLDKKAEDASDAPPAIPNDPCRTSANEIGTSAAGAKQANKASNSDMVNLKDCCMSLVTGIPLPRLKLMWLLVEGRLLLDTDIQASPYPFPKLTGRADHLRPRLQIPRELPTRDLLNVDIVSQIDAVSHPLTQEHQLLLTQLRQIIRQMALDNEPQTLDAYSRALRALQSSAGLAQLLPYLVVSLVYQVYAIVGKSEVFPFPAAGLRATVEALGALITSPHSQLHSCIHQVLQALLFVVVHPTLLPTESLEVSVALRFLSAEALRDIVHSYAAVHMVSLDVPIISVFLKILERDYIPPAVAAQPPDSTTLNLSCLLGAVIGLRSLGSRAIRSTLVPLTPRLAHTLESLISSGAAEAASQQQREVAVWTANELLGALCEGLSPSDSSLQLLDRSANAPSKALEAAAVLLSVLGDAADQCVLAAAQPRQQQLLQTTAHGAKTTGDVVAQGPLWRWAQALL